MKNHLYINSKGYPVTRHSYSGSESFNFCARKYNLQRSGGWKPRETRAATQFGICIENAVRYLHMNDMKGGTEEFARQWAEYKGTQLLYSKIEGSWERLDLDGRELMQLYVINYPRMPFEVRDPLKDFQVETNLKMKDDLEGLEYTSFIDVLGYQPGIDDRIIIDMKTSGKAMPELISLDPQLRSYAFVKKIYRVGFVWFRKCGREFSKGDIVTLLKPVGDWKVGETVTVANIGAEEDFGIWIASKTLVEGLDLKFVGRAKAVEAERREFLKRYAFLVQESTVTKQRIEWGTADISRESAEEIGKSIVLDMRRIRGANETNFWPMQSGIRFPNEKCPNCEMRGICANIPKLRDELLIRQQVDELDFGKEGE